jgi:transglutaminase-like putative cysteine protease
VEEYLRPTGVIDHDNETIRLTAMELTRGCADSIEKAQALFYFVRDRIKYNLVSANRTPDDFRASRVLDRKEGNCIQKSILLSALARAVGIPARLRFANFKNHKMPSRVVDILGTNVAVFHGYTDLSIEERWVTATPAFDLETCRAHRLAPVEFDGRKNAKFHPHDLDGNLFAEYVREYGHYEDLPFDQMTDAWTRQYGKHWAQLFDELRRSTQP